MIITKEYAAARRKRAYDNTVYRCLDCGFEGWGATTVYHDLSHTDHLGMVALEQLIGQDVIEPVDVTLPAVVEG